MLVRQQSAIGHVLLVPGCSGGGPHGRCWRSLRRLRRALPCPSYLASHDHIQARRLEPNPRCAACQSGGMYHPMHKWWACDVRLPDGEFCGCTVTDRPVAL